MLSDDTLSFGLVEARGWFVHFKRIYPTTTRMLGHTRKWAIHDYLES